MIIRLSPTFTFIYAFLPYTHRSYIQILFVIFSSSLLVYMCRLSSHVLFLPYVPVERSSFLLRVVDIPSVNHGTKPAIITEIFRDFTHFLNANVGKILSKRLRPLNPHVLSNSLLFIDAE